MTTYMNKIIESYIIRNKVMNKTDIKTLAKLLLFDERLLTYVRDVTTNDYLDTNYCFASKTLNINLSSIIKETKFEDKELFKDIFSVRQIIQKMNLNIIKYILHEIEHVRQHYVLSKKQNTIEKRLIDMSFNHYYYDNQTKKEKIEEEIAKEYVKFGGFYYSEPAERMAFILSGNKIVKLVKDLDLNQNIIDLFKLEVLQDEDYEYKIIDNRIIYPLKTYMEILKSKLNKDSKILHEKYLKSIVNKNNFSLKKRMMYGFKITKKEYIAHENMLKENKIFQMIYNS